MRLQNETQTKLQRDGESVKLKRSAELYKNPYKELLALKALLSVDFDFPHTLYNFHWESGDIKL